MRIRQTLVPNPVVLIMVPDPQPGAGLAAILMMPLDEPVDQEQEGGCSASTSSEEPSTRVGVIVPPPIMLLLT